MNHRARKLDFTISIVGCLVLVVSARPASAISLTPLSKSAVNERIQASVKYSDLVIRGTVVDISTNSVSALSLYPESARDQSEQIGVARWNVDVLERIKGSCADRIAIVIPLYIAMGAVVEPGQEFVMCVDYCDALSSYMIRDFMDGTFRRSGNQWESAALLSPGGIEYAIRDIEAIALSSDPVNIMSPSDVVVVGSILSVNVEQELQGDRVRSTRTLEVRIQDVVRGEINGNKVTIVWQDNSPPGILHAPSFTAGEEWYFILRRDANMFAPVDGSNSFLKRERDRLLYNGRVPYTRSVRELNVEVQQR